MTVRFVALAGKGEGRPPGGPLVFAAMLGWLAAGCAGSPPGEPSMPRAAGAVARPLDTYRELGLHAGPAGFPAVLDIVTLAGPADSTYVILAMSLPNRALRFERDGGGFAAGYTVAAELRRDAIVTQRIERRDTVRVPSFVETARTDESIIFQDAGAVLPGRHVLVFRAADEGGGGTFEVVDTLDVPAYGPEAQQLAGPLFILEGAGRTVRDVLPRLILNARHTAAYGAADPRIYIEWYGAGGPVPLDVQILDERNAPVGRLTATIAAGETAVRSTTVELPSAELPMGRMWVTVGLPGEEPALRAPFVLSISDQWMVANFEEMLQFLRYIATEEEIGALREGSARERRERWDAFWRARDPLPATPGNEFRDEFFDRVRYATEHFAEAGGIQGWRTDRGEAYIVLGPPDYTQERYIAGTDLLSPDGLEWTWEDLPGGRLTLLFVDRTGFGRYSLTPSSRTAFHAAANRLRPR